MNEYIKKEVRKELKNDLLKDFTLQRDRWKQIKNKDQDVTQENFIDNVILVYEWIIGDLERM